MSIEYLSTILRQQLGDSYISTTSGYSAVMSKDLDEALEKLDEEAL